jgi:DNA helicase-2/ATP-dependent DNA helicase PcrA
MPEIKPTQRQYKVITHTGGHARVIAGPGSGKSKTLVSHIAHSILNNAVDPRSILVLAFNRAIAEKLKQDLAEHLGEDPSRYPIIMTLHSYALRLLKRFRISADIGNATFPSSEEMPLIHKVVARYLKSRTATYKGRPIDVTAVNKRLFPLYSKHYWFGVPNIKPEEEGILRLVHDGLAFTKAFFGIRFLGELPAELRKLIGTEPESRIHYSKIVINEYQDLNLEDIELIKVLVDDDTEVIIAGDDDQSICSYRGADSRGLSMFIQDFPAVTAHELDECFRCPQKVFQYGQAVINQIPSQERIQKIVTCTSTREGFVANWVFKSPESERGSLIELVKQYTIKEPENSVLIVLPKNDYIPIYLRELTAAGLAVEDLSNLKPDDNLKKFWLVLRVLVNPSNQLAIQGILSLKETRWLGLFEKLLEKIDWASYRTTMIESIREHRADLEASSSGKNRVALENVYKLIDEIENYQKWYAARRPTIKEDLIEATVVCKWLFPDYDPASSLSVIDSVTEQLLESGIKIDELFEVLSYFLPIIEEKPAPNPDIKIRVTTLGKAKGLEADLVIVPDLEDNILPGQRDLSEAKRLLYVAITRAIKVLIIASVKIRRGGYGAGDTSRLKIPSRLLPASPRVEVGETEAQRICSNIAAITTDLS